MLSTLSSSASVAIPHTAGVPTLYHTLHEFTQTQMALPCARAHNNKSVQLPWGFHYHHLGSMTLVISGEYV